jgi:hypothetical protein
MWAAAMPQTSEPPTCYQLEREPGRTRQQRKFTRLQILDVGDGQHAGREGELGVE